MTEIRRINLESKDLIADRVQRLLELFPEVAAERERERERVTPAPL